MCRRYALSQIQPLSLAAQILYAAIQLPLHRGSQKRSQSPQCKTPLSAIQAPHYSALPRCAPQSYSTDFSDSTILTFLRRKCMMKSTKRAKISVSTNAAAKHHSGSVLPNMTESVCAT